MAHGLHAIAHANYAPDYDGRDWFFTGDAGYKNGKKGHILTPTELFRAPGRTDAPARRGVPREIVMKRAGQKVSKVERWRRLHEESGNSSKRVDAAATRSASVPSLPGCVKPDAPAHVPYLNQRIADEMRAMSSVKFEEAKSPGDCTRGIRGQQSHFAATSWRHGDWSGRSYHLPLAQELVDAGVTVPEGEPRPVIKGKKPHFHATYSDLGQVPGFKLQERGVPHKHCHMPTFVFPDRIFEETGGVLPQPPAKGDKAGDHTCGIKAKCPHFFSTSWDLGQLPECKGKHYDFGPLAFSRYRLTEWGKGKDCRKDQQ